MARAKNDNLVNEFDRVCHCCQRHIHFERNKSVENVVFFDGLFYHEKCFKESAGFHRKCGGCSKDIIIEDADQEGIEHWDVMVQISLITIRIANLYLQ